jgi:hypothetical protein
LAFAIIIVVIIVVVIVVIIATPAHALLTVSHDVPVRQPFALCRRGLVQTMARRERTTRLTAPSRTQFRIPIRIPFAWPDIDRQSTPMAISVAASCASAVAMTTATPRPRFLTAALPTPRHAHFFVSKRCAQSVKHPNPSLARPGDFVCRVLFNRLFVIGRHSASRCSLAEHLAPGIVAVQPSRVDSVAGS